MVGSLQRRLESVMLYHNTTIQISAKGVAVKNKKNLKWRVLLGFKVFSIQSMSLLSRQPPLARYPCRPFDRHSVSLTPAIIGFPSNIQSSNAAALPPLPLPAAALPCLPTAAVASRRMF
ncbi:unnamed protein product [Citrullus colocynthis]|uniref:Uncharacterized protein n=1 Tax=Citrullus colocynthis TaxID=252529 RepID=A0ABP0YX89_9ROSI